MAAATYGLSGSMALTNPDFAALARAFGISTMKIRSTGAPAKALTGRASWEEPFLVELLLPVFPPPWRL